MPASRPTSFFELAKHEEGTKRGLPGTIGDADLVSEAFASGMVATRNKKEVPFLHLPCCSLSGKLG